MSLVRWARDLVVCSALLAASAAPLGCGPSSRVRSAESESVTAGEEEEAGLCALPLATRLERARAVALSARRWPPHTRGDDEAAISRWAPRGRDGAAQAEPVSMQDRASIVQVVRRVLERCAVDDAVALTRELVAFQTVAAIAPPSENPEHVRMAAFLAQWAEAHGLSFRTHGASDAWELELAGRAPERRITWVVHADVVPVNDPPTVLAPDVVPAGWTRRPFEASLEGDRLYGRGTEDDKGPMAAAMIVLATLASAGLVPDGPLVLAAGTAEEEDWEGMRRYAAEAPRARHTISLDSEFPVVTAQSGFVAWGLRVPPRSPPRSAGRGGREPAYDAEAVDARGGLFLTQVPDAAELVLRPRGEAPALRTQVEAAIDAELASRAADASGAVSGFSATAAVELREGVEHVVLRARGVSVHSSQAEDGRNAIELLAAIASRLSLREGPVARLLSIVHASFDRDFHGAALGLAYEDPFMGALLVTPTVLRLEDGVARIEVNMRRPAGRTTEQFEASLAEAVSRLRARFGDDVTPIDEPYVGEPHVVSSGDGSGVLLVDTLVDVYARVTGAPRAEAVPHAIRGGTYARLFEGAVDFGPALPGERYTGHGADEHVTLRALETTARAAFETALILAFEP